MKKGKKSKQDISRYRVAGVVESVSKPAIEDHGILTMYVTIALNGGKGSHQGFGGLALNNKIVNSYVRELCETFDVLNLSDLKGKKCFALYSFDSLNEPIEGLESLDTGKRFLHNVWRKKHFPETGSVLYQKRESLCLSLACAERRVLELREKLSKLEDEFVDWKKL